MTDPVDLQAYGAALDEVYVLRRALAYEARVVEAQTLDLSRLGKGRRRHLEECIERMRQAARGESARAYASTSRQSLDQCMKQAGGSNLLTRYSWESVGGYVSSGRGVSDLAPPPKGPAPGARKP